MNPDSAPALNEWWISIPNSNMIEAITIPKRTGTITYRTKCFLINSISILSPYEFKVIMASNLELSYLLNKVKSIKDADFGLLFLN